MIQKLCGKKTKYWSSSWYVGDTQIPPYKPYSDPCILSLGHKGRHNNGNLKWHQTKKIKLSNGKILPEIDCGIAELIRSLNEKLNLRTGASCQGERKRIKIPNSAYVSIYGSFVKNFAKKLRKTINIPISIEIYNSIHGGLYWDPKYTKILTTCVQQVLANEKS